MYVICASPLVRVYLPEWHDRLMDDPALMYSEEPFEFTFSTGVGGIRIKYNTPTHVMNLGRKTEDEKAVKTLFDWLTGGPEGTWSQDTEIYGIVPFDPQIDLVGTQDQMALLEAKVSGDDAASKKAAKALEKMKADTSAKLKATRAHVRAASDARIMRAMRTTHNNLIRQWQTNEEMKMGKYPPSTTELFGAHVLDKEIKAAQLKGSKLKENMAELMRNTVV
jgi:hypothetical protein